MCPRARACVCGRGGGGGQTAFYFGYMSVACYAASLLLGAVGFLASFSFVAAIYRSIKCD